MGIIHILICYIHIFVGAFSAQSHNRDTRTQQLDVTMLFHETTLPWRDEPVLQTGNIAPWLIRQIPTAIRPHLPDRMMIAFDHNIGRHERQELILSLPEFFKTEFSTRHNRIDAAIRQNHGWLTDEQANRLVYKSRNRQPWLIYAGSEGGLPESVPDDKMRGMVPCSSMTNHGVAWHSDRNGHTHPLLVTARKPGALWDYGSDFGHESGHAAFSPVPLFLQSPHVSGNDWHLTGIRDVKSLQPGHIARLMYTYCEWAVIAVRGEQRNTPTGLPVTEHADEAVALLEVSHKIMPNMGFDRALGTLERHHGKIDPQHPDIWSIGAASLECTPLIHAFIDKGIPPDLKTFNIAADFVNNQFAPRAAKKLFPFGHRP